MAAQHVILKARVISGRHGAQPGIRLCL